MTEPIPPIERRQGYVDALNRLAVVESKVTEQNERIHAFIERLDQHIAVQAERESQLQHNLTCLTQKLGETNAALGRIALVAEANNQRWGKIDFSINVLTRVGMAFVAIVTGIWALYTFIVDHPEVIGAQPTVIKK